MQWLTVCSVDDLQPDSGVCALLEGRQVAIFWMPALRLRSENALIEPPEEHTPSGAEERTLSGVEGPVLSGVEGAVAKVYAVGNYDPFGKANVLSRGLIGDINGQPVVASPLYKQHFNLQTGVCLEDETVKIPVYAIRVNNGSVQIDISSLQQDGAAL